MNSPPPLRPKMFDEPSTYMDVVGRRRSYARDVYHGLLRAPWSVFVAGIAAAFLCTNALFALAYFESDGIANARPGSFADAFFFSVQTMGTIGYGAMYPKTQTANVIVVIETLAGTLQLGVIAGIVFAKFAAVRARITFARSASVTPVDGVPTFMFRIANERGNYIVDTHIRVTVVQPERSSEGHMMYRMRDLVLVRDRFPMFSGTCMIMHTITKDSPLFGLCPENARVVDPEIAVTVVGIDGTTNQSIHAGHSYLVEELRWGARPADMLTELPNGRVRVDWGNFHEMVPTQPTDTFPYSAED